jgi:hypothetical protein
MRRMQRVCWMRQRDWCGATGNMAWMFESAESSMDLTELLRSLKFDEKTLATLDDTCFAYERDITAGLMALYDRMLAFQRSNEMWSAEWQRMNAENPEAAIDFSDRYQELIGDSQTKFSEAGRAVAQVNLATMQKFQEQLTPADWLRFQRAYNVKAFPDIYEDPRSPAPALDRALALDDLTGDQRARLSDLAASFRPAFETLCDDAAALRREFQRPMWAAMTDQDEVRRWQEQQSKQERLDFERTELLARTISRMQMLLTEEQLRRVGGLPTIDETNRHGMGW